MYHILRILVACVFMLPTLVLAQQDSAKASADQDKLTLLSNLMHEKDRGFVASKLILSDSFASYLHGDAGTLTVEQLSALPVAYDPQSGSGATVGMLYFHLAYPVLLLRELGGARNEILARVIENRLRWLAGDTDRALEVAVLLISQVEDIGLDDAAMTSLLADAAVLSWRAGQGAAARQFLDRARSCGQVRCPQDIVFEWLGETHRPHGDRMVDYNVDLLRDQALLDGETIWPGNARIVQDIHQEALLMSDQSNGAVAEILRQAQAVTNPDDLSGDERRRFGQMAARIMGLPSNEEMAMTRSSMAGIADDLVDDNGRLSTQNLPFLSYAKKDNLFLPFMLRGMPLIHNLLRFSNRRGDDVVADTITARLILARSDYARASLELQRLVAKARALGFTNGELHSALMDLWVAASLAGDTEIADQAEQGSLACRQLDCDEDLVAGFFMRAAKLPRMQYPTGLKEFQIDVADPYLRATFPGDMLALADLYKTGVGGSQSKPMDGVRYDALSLHFAEQASGISGQELQKRAAHAMDTMVYAGQYSAAADAGDRIIARLTDSGEVDELSIRFYQIRGRAAFRLGDSNARRFYEIAVDLAVGGGAAAIHDWLLPEDLSLDLQDTPYLDLLDKLATHRPVDPAVVARLRYRQGRFQDAADVMQSLRRSAELNGFDLRSSLAEMFEARKQIHLQARNLDAYVAAHLSQVGNLDGSDVPADHPLYYNINDTMKVFAEQEAVYRIAAGDPERARQLRVLATGPGWNTPWQPLGDTRDPEAIALWESRSFRSFSTYRYISNAIDLRDNGNYEGAASLMRQFRWIAVVAEANGEYIDAQTLWQMAFTFARVGEADTAFGLMNRAARIAATLSFEGAGGADGGTLQLLERDRWRYLLFVDIAWAAVSGQSPDEMLVVSRY